jgi:hypothetical protein
MFSEIFPEEFQIIFFTHFIGRNNYFYFISSKTNSKNFFAQSLCKLWTLFFLYKTIDYTWKNEKERMSIN